MTIGLLPITMLLALTGSASAADLSAEPTLAEPTLAEAGSADLGASSLTAERKGGQKSPGASGGNKGGQRGSSANKGGGQRTRSEAPRSPSNNNARPQGQSGSKPSHMPGSDRNAEATRPDMQRGGGGVSVMGGSSRSGGMDQDSARTTQRDIQRAPVTQGSRSGSSAGTVMGSSGDARSPGRVEGSRSGGSLERPSTGGDRVVSGGSRSSGGSRASGSSSSGSRAGSAERPSSGGDRVVSNGSRAGASRHAGERSPTRPSSSRAGAASASRAGSHARPGAAAAQVHKRGSYHGKRARHYRPTTPIHRYYYRGLRPVYAAPGPRVNVRWYHGVFVYGPYPHHHHHYAHGGGGGGGTSSQASIPERAVDRNDTFSLGINGGSYLTAYDLGAGFSDVGIGAHVRYRPVETLGFELSYSYYDQTFDSDTERQTATLQPSLQLFAIPWTRVSPYVSLGASVTNRNYDDSWSDGVSSFTAEASETAWGPMGGVGIEFALGERAAIGVEGRYTHYLNVGGDDPQVPSALQGKGTLSVYF